MYASLVRLRGLRILIKIKEETLKKVGWRLLSVIVYIGLVVYFYGVALTQF